MLKITLRWGLAFAAVTLFVPQGFAHAYLDPGSGSFILQILAASLLGFLFTFRVWGQRFLNIFRKPNPKLLDDDSSAPALTDQDSSAPALADDDSSAPELTDHSSSAPALTDLED